ncbi:MAG: hypothetical protein IJ794_08335 [Lachnospiraceae bacterium]|nr:hypothetical protein [Lachnospiraceae bacterium]
MENGSKMGAACLTEEMRKLFHQKMLAGFWFVCLVFNIGLTAVTFVESGGARQMAAWDTAQAGEAIFQDIHAGNLGRFYYDERYRESDLGVELMHRKYEKLEVALRQLEARQADLSTYAGEATPYVHRALFT